MTASPQGPAAPPALEHPGGRTWVSTTGRWWAVREATLTRRQVAAGCVPQLHAATGEALSRRIGNQEALSAAAVAQAADLADWSSGWWPSGWRAGRRRF